MGRENTIVTGTTRRNNRQGLSVNSNSLNTLLPSSTYQFGLVIGVNPTTKEIIYNAIEDNVAVNKQGKALPLYKNKIQLPDIGYVVPLLRGPNTDISVNGGQYSKTTYYLDPIGIWQTVEENKIEKSPGMSPNTPASDVNKLNIKLTEIGIPTNPPVLDKTTIDAAQRPLPSPMPSPSPNIEPPVTSPPAPLPTASNFTFRIRLNYETWIADIYNNNILIGTKEYVFINFTEASIREALTNEAKYFGFFINNNFYPPQPNII